MQVRFPRSAARVGMAAVASITALALAGCGSSSSAGSGGSSGSSQSGDMTIRLAYNPNPTNTSIVVAQEQGFFKKNGLTVKLTASEASAALLPSIGKQYDIITETPPTILQGAAHGYQPILVGAEDVENGTSLRNSYLIGSKDITSVAQLKGKTIGVPTLSGNLYEGAVLMLAKAGISKNEVKMLQVPFNDTAADLQSGTIQAASTIFPYQFQLLGEGMHDLGDPMQFAFSGGGNALSAGWAAYAPWVKANPKAIAAFDKSQAEALAWMKANPAKAQQILVKDFQLPASVAKTFPVTKFVSFDVQDSYLEPWIAPMKKVGDLPADFHTSASQLVYQP